MYTGSSLFENILSDVSLSFAQTARCVIYERGAYAIYLFDFAAL